MTRNDLEKPLIHDLLSNRRRRKVLKQMQREVGTIGVEDLARRIAEAESEKSHPPRQLKRSVYNSLHQHHLPKLDDAGVVSYDSDRKTVELLDGVRSVHLYMEVVGPHGLSWAEYYRYVGVLGLLTVVAVETDMPVLVGVPDVAVPTAFLALLAVSVGYQLWSQRWMYLRQLLD